MSCPQIVDSGLTEAEIRRAEHIVLLVDIWAGAMESLDGGVGLVYVRDMNS